MREFAFALLLLGFLQAAASGQPAGNANANPAKRVAAAGVALKRAGGQRQWLQAYFEYGQALYELGQNKRLEPAKARQYEAAAANHFVKMMFAATSSWKRVGPKVKMFASANPGFKRAFREAAAKRKN